MHAREGWGIRAGHVQSLHCRIRLAGEVVRRFLVLDVVAVFDTKLRTVSVSLAQSQGKVSVDAPCAQISL